MFLQCVSIYFYIFLCISVVYCSLFIVHCLLFIVYCSLFIVLYEIRIIRIYEFTMCFYLFQFISVLHFYFMSSPKNINWLKVTTYFHIVIFHLVNKLFSNINITINSENNFLLISN